MLTIILFLCLLLLISGQNICSSDPDQAQTVLQFEEAEKIFEVTTLVNCGETCFPIEGSCLHCVSIAFGDQCSVIDEINSLNSTETGFSSPILCCTVKEIEGIEVCGQDLNVSVVTPPVVSSFKCSLDSTNTPTQSPSASPTKFPTVIDGVPTKSPTVSQPPTLPPFNAGLQNLPSFLILLPTIFVIAVLSLY